ncbi:MAG: class I SAM-dependent methyltransferase [candidate division Zixibacteria bacterium]|nr:class I SAM-dependent methyltransferase [candidate division Zixibacteria bacterium]
MQQEQLRSCDLCQSNELETLGKSSNICRCQACGYIFDNPRPSLEDIIQYYSSEGQYDVWLEQSEGRDLLWKRRLSIITDFAKEGNLLDVGAGIGQFLYYARQFFKVQGTEVSKEAIKIAKERYSVELIEGTLKNINSFQSNSFDVITLTHVLEHVPHPSETLKKCYDLLKRGGFLFISVPNENSWSRLYLSEHGGFIKYCVKLFLKKLGVRKYKTIGRFKKIMLDPQNHSEIHLSHFTFRPLKSFLEKSGFKIILDSLDPYYPFGGWRGLKEGFAFRFYKFTKNIFSYNLYDTMLIIARKLE